MAPQNIGSHLIANGDRGSQRAAAIVFNKIYMGVPSQ
jgi:hypothetical protein